MNINLKINMQSKVEKLARDIGMIYPEEIRVIEDITNLDEVENKEINDNGVSK